LLAEALISARHELPKYPLNGLRSAFEVASNFAQVGANGPRSGLELKTNGGLAGFALVFVEEGRDGFDEAALLISREAANLFEDALHLADGTGTPGKSGLVLDVNEQVLDVDVERLSELRQ
jgi:hypothetical protein